MLEARGRTAQAAKAPALLGDRGRQPNSSSEGSITKYLLIYLDGKRKPNYCRTEFQQKQLGNHSVGSKGQFPEQGQGVMGLISEEAYLTGLGGEDEKQREKYCKNRV